MAQFHKISYEVEFPDYGTEIDMRTIKRLNGECGFHFFSEDTMRFFNSKVYDDTKPVSNGWLFITSERNDRPYSENKREWTLRLFKANGQIDTIGEFGQYSSLKQAQKAMRDYND